MSLKTRTKPPYSSAVTAHNRSAKNAVNDMTLGRFVCFVRHFFDATSFYDSEDDVVA
jgi:hypothetical protein